MDFLKDFISKYWGKLEKKQKAYLIVFLAVIVVLMWAFISAGVITHNFNRNILNDSANNQELEVRDMILTESKDGQKMWEIYGETGSYSNDHKTATLHNLIGNFYKENSINMSIQARKGIYDETTHNIDLYDDIFVVLENDITVIADHIKYFSETKIIEADGNVKINQKGAFVSTAEKAVVNPTFDVFRIQGHAVTKIYEKGNKTSTNKGIL